jgi:hypothetical protein
MERLRTIARELIGLFVDDSGSAAFTTILIVIVAGLVKLMDVPPLWGALGLTLGVAAILVESLVRVVKAGRKR